MMLLIADAEVLKLRMTRAALSLMLTLKLQATSHARVEYC
jgi:hypothetical protein